MGVTNMKAILTDERVLLIYKFGGLFVALFFVLVIPAYNYVHMQHILQDQQEVHEKYVKETEATIGILSDRLNVVSQKYQNTASFKKEANCLADNIYHEIGTDSKEGMLAVAQVTINRVRNHFANTVCGVVNQKRNDTCQFSWVCQEKKRPHDSSYEKAYEVAKNTLIDGVALYKLNDALYYHADYIRPYWAKQKEYIAQIGPHIFYTDKVTEDGN
jgi:spore germination cell wall hydrolase CwlJ-like protein